MFQPRVSVGSPAVPLGTVGEPTHTQRFPDACNGFLRRLTHHQRVPAEKPCADLQLCTSLAFPLGSLPLHLERWGTPHTARRSSFLFSFLFYFERFEKIQVAHPHTQSHVTYDQHHSLTTGELQVGWVRVCAGGCQLDLLLKKQIHLLISWNRKSVCSLATLDMFRKQFSHAHTLTRTSEPPLPPPPPPPPLKHQESTRLLQVDYRWTVCVCVGVNTYHIGCNSIVPKN